MPSQKPMLAGARLAVPPEAGLWAFKAGRTTRRLPQACDPAGPAPCCSLGFPPLPLQALHLVREGMPGVREGQGWLASPLVLLPPLRN